VKAIVTLSGRAGNPGGPADGRRKEPASAQATAGTAFFLPKGTPDGDRSQDARRHRCSDGDTLRARAARGLGSVIVAPDRRSPDYLAGFVKSEIAKWAEPIRASGAVVD